MADPLSLLREYVSSGRIEEVVISGDRVDFGGKYSFSKLAATGYKSQQGKGKLYDVETLLFFSKNINAKYGEYFRRSNKELNKAVAFVDRKDLHDYLTGQTDRSDYIQLAVPEFDVGQPAKRARLDAGSEAALGPAAAATEQPEESPEDAAVRKIRESELQLRDRNSMLSMPGRSFRKVLTILGQAQRDQQAQVAQLKAQHQKAQKSNAQEAVIPVRPSGRYERQTQQDATLKQLGAAELGVRVGFKPATAAAAEGGTGAPEQQSAAPPAPPPSRPPAPAPSAKQQPRKNGSSSSSRPAPGRQVTQQQRPERRGTPVIMVPPGMTALLNMHNIQPFLEEGRFMTTEEAKAAKLAKAQEEGRQPPKDGLKKEERITIQRIVGRDRPVKYYVTDKEPAHGQDWERVVAVICLGKAWQFKKWPHKGASSGDLVDTFSNVLGVYLHYSDEAVDATVKSWNVRVLALPRQSRHRDATVAQEFWRMLDSHLQARGSTLLY